jgi:DNA adenine methylase
MYEPFAGSAALSLAAAALGVAEGHVLGESLAPLAGLWALILDAPGAVAAGYRRLWEAGRHAPQEHFASVRAGYNRTRDPVALLYLLARCVKNAPRFNPGGDFNQSADRRRRGVRPERLERALLGASGLLAGRCEVRVGDFWDTLRDAGEGDLVYLDPPWEGTTVGRDKRYHQGLPRERLVAALEGLSARGVALALSYDGRRGARTYGAPLPASLGLRRVELVAGRSSQATLLGRAEVTIESLYLSRELGTVPGM